jgi:cytochrome c oxidase assembly protein subunit 15
MALVDLSPLLQLLLVGAAVATPLLGWTLWRQRWAGPRDRLAALTVLTVFLTFDLVVFGAFTRLTDSGLGCPDWPGCYGHSSPIGARAAIEAEQAVMPTGPVTHGKAWIEMVHRYLATGVGALIVALLALRWRWRSALDQGPEGLRWAGLTLLWVLAQGAFGALTVTMKLFPAIVTAHLLGGVGLLALLAAQWAQLAPLAAAGMPHRWRPSQRRAAALLLGLVVFQVALGGWTSTNYAVLACSEFPRCQGSWWPAMNFSEGFAVWRPLGLTAAGEPISFAALTAIHYVHRLYAYALLLLLWGMAFWLYRTDREPRLAKGLALLGLWQLLTGLSNVVLGWPLLAAVAHTGGAAALVALLAFHLARPEPQFASARSAALHPSNLPA